MICPECGSRVILKHSPKYNRYFYGCTNWPECNVTVGCHLGTTAPLGTPASQETRSWRIKAHNVFDNLWNSGLMKRGEAYLWMQKKLSLPKGKAHIGMFNIDKCKRLIAEVNKRINKEGR